MRKPEYGAEIADIRPQSIAEEKGLLRGDLILAVNSQKIRDPIDFMFYSADDYLNIDLRRDRKIISLEIKRERDRDLGIQFKSIRVKTCKNNCIFCFVKQLPKGLRKSLYVKDEDYRMSFLYGNYITMTNLSKKDKERIIKQRLSPLYISVHSTNKTLRNKLIGNSKAPDIMRELKFLADNKIRFNAQVVLCPGYNDGKELHRTISDLSNLFPYLLSISVVPIGLTIYRKHNIPPVEKKDAEKALELIHFFQKRLTKRYGNPIVFGADELYLKAGYSLPSVKEYGELYQIENGVGMVPLFINQAKSIKLPKDLSINRKFITFTGTSFYPFLKRFIDKLTDKEKINLQLVAIENRIFGSFVTVAGLLTGRDVIKAILDKVKGNEIILVPDVVLNDEDKFLDDISISELEEAVGVPAKKIESTPEGLVKGILEEK